MNNSYEISELIKRSITGEILPEEKLILNNWLKESDENRELYEKLKSIDFQLDKLSQYSSFNKERIKKNIEKELFPKSAFNHKTYWYKYAAAILIPIVFIIGYSLLFKQNKEITLANIDESITPGTQKATLVLSNGENIILDAKKNKNTFNEGGVVITNQENKLNYLSGGEKSYFGRSELVYNELKTPRGGGYNLQLSDGTNVWLNSGSSLRFPVSFTDTVRQVYLSGEAYFDVSHNGKPFMVTTNNLNVHVLGTQFNLSAYEDEKEIVTTLVEGKVAITLLDSNAVQDKILTPGLQSRVNKESRAIGIEKVNTSQFTSWIHGKLEFNNQDLEYVMKRLSRWYDFNYSFANNNAKKYRFSARVNTDESISEILKMLEMTTSVKFQIEENNIIVN